MLVVKVGGGADIDREAVCEDLARSWAREPMVLLHGASKELDEVSARLGSPPRTLTSASGIQSRFTDDRTMRIFSMVYAGAANQDWVRSLQRWEVAALGLSGVDGRLLFGPEKEVLRSRLPDGREQLVRGDRSGRVESVNADLLRLLLGAGYLPVVSPPAVSNRGRAMNVDADRAAARVAAALSASTLVILSDVPGLLRDPSDPTSLVKDVRRHEISLALEMARGRMRTKVLAAKEALQLGVRRVVFADGRLDSPLERARKGQGTVFRFSGVPRRFP